MIVPTNITIPKPEDAENITDAATKNVIAIPSGLSPASSAAFFIIDLVTPTLLSICPNQAPKINPAIAVDIFIAPASKTFLAIV